MEKIKNYIVKDDDFGFDTDENFIAIPDKYKGSSLYIVYGRVYEAHMRYAEQYPSYSMNDTVNIICDIINSTYLTISDEERGFIIKWLFCIFEPDMEYDMETGECSNPNDESDEEEEEEDA
jgi:hypothetical protein